MACTDAVVPDLLPLPGDPRWRRALVLGVFLGLLVLFRHLAPVFVCFVVLVRGLGRLSRAFEAHTGMVHRRSMQVMVTAFGLVLAALGVIAVGRALPRVRALRAGGREQIEELAHHPSVEWVRHLHGAEGGGDLVDTLKLHAVDALHYATRVVHLAAYVLVGLILAVVYLLEQDEIDGWVQDLVPASITGTIIRWIGYVADAVAITVRMQAVTAVVNACITLPVLLALRLPHLPTLTAVILVSGLVPVVGNFVAGSVLCVVAIQHRGLWAAGVFVVVSFVLHKIESYFLVPRLASHHVALPGLLLIVSLLLFEQLFGFWGLFLSFPSLYVGQRILHEWEGAPAPSESLVPPSPS
ncbi:MAG: AI-2E family transporter [Myxococcaceae bacterium]|nr:MAG: AI-2E family transporter [Myxococcaceae bacterium]